MSLQLPSHSVSSYIEDYHWSCIVIIWGVEQGSKLMLGSASDASQPWLTRLLSSCRLFDNPLVGSIEGSVPAYGPLILQLKFDGTESNED